MKSLPFFKGLSWLIFLNLLVKPAWIFLVDREVQNIVGHEAYGQYFALLNLSYVLFFLSDAGLTTMLTQRIAEKYSRVDTAVLLRFKFVLLAIYTLAMVMAAIMSGISQWQILWYIIAIQVLNSSFIFLRGMITAHQFFSADAWFSVIDKLLMTLICGTMIYSVALGQINLLRFLQVQTICTALAVVAAAIFIFSKNILHTQGIKEDAREIIQQITPFALIILLMSLYTRADGFLLERMHTNGAFEAGIYASAFRLLEAGNMVGYLAASFLVPFIARNQHDKKLLGTVILNTRHGLIFLAILVSSFGFFFAPWIQKFLYRSEDPYNALVIGLTITVLPASYLVHIYSSALTATKQFRSLISILVLTVLINLTLNISFMPAYGAEAAAWSAIASQYFCGIACYFAASKKLEISAGAGSWILYLILLISLGTLYYFGKMVKSNEWTILAMAVLMVFLLLAFQYIRLKKHFISR